MKKGKLIKDKKTWKIDGGGMKRPMPILGNFGLTDDMEGKEIEFNNSGGPVKCIRFEGKDYINITKNNKIDKDKNGDLRKKERQMNGKNNRNNRQGNDPARAPYNFIPLNKKVVPSDGSTDHSLFNGLSGYIDLTLETKQPLFIRGGDKLFFNNDGKYIVPGSSVRGMIANLVNIVSYGKFLQFKDKRLYRRSNQDDDKKSKVSAGFLYKYNGKYKIRDASFKQEDRNIKPFSYQFENNTCVFSPGKFGKGNIVWKVTLKGDKELDLSSDVVESYKSDKNRTETVIDLIKSVERNKITDNIDENDKGKIKKRLVNRCSIPKELGIPVFYRLNEKGEVMSFGHAKYYRMPYEKSIKDHINQEDSIKEADFNETLFGNMERASKLFFEDLTSIDAVKFDLEKCEPHKILSSPKPTSYQHYLKQPAINKSKQKNWSDDVPIRGFKNYWHRETSSNKNHENTWIAENSDKNNPDPIKPASPGNTFSGRIRFDNLTKTELGALLFVLNLPEGCCHKLGLGKPLGLGSVRIIPELTLIKRKERYQTLFDPSGSWNLAEDSTANIEEYKNCFAKYMGQHLSNSLIADAKSYWDKDERMKVLQKMLTYQHNVENSAVSWIDRTRYMELEEFDERPILPTPEDVTQPNRYKNK